MTVAQRAAVVLAAGWVLCTCAAHAATEIGPMRYGLPGLHHTVVPQRGFGAPARLGLVFDTMKLDPSYGFGATTLGPSITSQQLRLQLALRASRYVTIAGSVPWRRVSSEGETITGFGDLETALSGRLFDTGRFAMGAWGMLRLPTGDDGKGLSTANVEGEFGLIGTFAFFQESLAPDLFWHLNVGYRNNKNEAEGYGIPSQTESLERTGVFPPAYPPSKDGEPAFNDEFLFRTALEFRTRWAHLFLEASLDWLANATNASFQESAAWITPGVYVGKNDGPGLKLAWSIGLHVDDVDTEYIPPLPDWTLTAAVNYPIFLGGRDDDLDTVPNDVDLCPKEPEDLDGYQDEDGCPDEDNDGDGILDRRDLAPNLAEDFDGFEDEDGRPDLDNDLDGIPDAVDDCPNQPEDFDGYQDGDGCPDVVIDSDNDGLQDFEDNCPFAAEDLDGFEDQDGCPELDNDLDGIVDDADQCPNEREDYDGVEDEDGCPDQP